MPIFLVKDFSNDLFKEMLEFRFSNATVSRLEAQVVFYFN